MLSLFLAGPVIFIVSLALPKSYLSTAVYAAIAVVIVMAHEALPAITDSDPAGNGMANGFRAILYFSAVSGFAFAGLYAMAHVQFRLQDQGFIPKLLLIVPALIGATFSFLLFA